MDARLKFISKIAQYLSSEFYLTAIDPQREVIISCDAIQDVCDGGDIDSLRKDLSDMELWDEYWEDE